MGLEGRDGGLAHLEEPEVLATEMDEPDIVVEFEEADLVSFATI